MYIYIYEDQHTKMYKVKVFFWRGGRLTVDFTVRRIGHGCHVFGPKTLRIRLGMAWSTSASEKLG